MKNKLQSIEERYQPKNQVIYGLYDLYYDYLKVVYNERANYTDNEASEEIWQKLCSIIDEYQIPSGQAVKLFKSTPQVVNMIMEQAEEEIEPLLTYHQINQLITAQEERLRLFLLNS